MSRTLVRGGVVLSLGAKTPNFAEADILIEDGIIVEISRGLRARDAETIEAGNAIVMPGFVDSHRHVWKSLFRNLGDSPRVPANEMSLQPDDTYAATLVGLLGAIEAGTTTVVDWADIPVTADHSDAALQAHVDAGLRTVFARAVPPDSGAEMPAAEAELRRLTGHTTGPSTTLAAGLGDVSSERQPTEGAWSTARELGLRVHAHAGVIRSLEGAVARLAADGLLTPEVTLVHCTHLDDSDLSAIASSGASVAITPTSEMSSGIGSPPVQSFIDRDIRPGLGVDDDQRGPGDIFAQMRATISLQHATYFDLKLAGKAGLPNLLTTREVIRYATIDGARAVGLGSVTGSLEPGKQADLIVLRTDRPNIFPINDPIGAVVWGMDTSNVDWVLVAGRTLVRDGSLVADLTWAGGLAKAAHQRVGASIDHEHDEPIEMGAGS